MGRGYLELQSNNFTDIKNRAGKQYAGPVFYMRQLRPIGFSRKDTLFYY
ncbi:hypothetical protein AGMMS50267_16330 [Spirochaetia bacterium]|nr:hypothetical protein AGMMS50267_16330 [Spirochaetia bacterium]